MSELVNVLEPSTEAVAIAEAEAAVANAEFQELVTTMATTVPAEVKEEVHHTANAKGDAGGDYGLRQAR